MEILFPIIFFSIFPGVPIATYMWFMVIRPRLIPIDPETNLPITPEGTAWSIEFRPDFSTQYVVYLIDSTKEPYTGPYPSLYRNELNSEMYGDCHELVYRSNLIGAIGMETAEKRNITQRDIVLTCVKILKNREKRHKRYLKNLPFSDNLAGVYPPKKMNDRV